MKKVMMLLCMLGLATPMFAQVGPEPLISSLIPSIIKIGDTFETEELYRAVESSHSTQTDREKKNQFSVRVSPMSKEEANRQLRAALQYENWDAAVDLLGQTEAEITSVVKNMPLTHEEANHYLILSSVYGDWGSVLSLIEDSGADPETTDEAGNTVLMFAAEQKNMAIIRYLIEYKNVDAQYINASNKALETALSLAENEEIFHYLINHGAVMECGN